MLIVVAFKLINMLIMQIYLLTYLLILLHGTDNDDKKQQTHKGTA